MKIRVSGCRLANALLIGGLSGFSAFSVAAVVDVSGGMITVNAVAGDGTGFTQTDYPDPVHITAGEVAASQSAHAEGTVENWYGMDAVSANSAASFNLSATNSSVSLLELTVSTAAVQSHAGPGYYVGASSNAVLSLDFSLGSEAVVFLAEYSPSIYSWGDAYITDSNNGLTIFEFCRGGWCNYYEDDAQFDLDAGDYNLYMAVRAPDYPHDFFANGGIELSLRFESVSTPAPVPLPAAAWLFLMGLGCFTAVRRKSNTVGS